MLGALSAFVREAESSPSDASVAAVSQTLIALLPARNAAPDLPGYLESVGRFADGVIALDDGSTDRTAELLGASPLVGTVLSNPPRRGYEGWDDGANRQRLLDAAIAEGAGWVLFLDADERIDPDDAVVLREFITGPADPQSAYGFRVFRMVEDLEHFDRAELWVYRLFRAAPGQALPSMRLHLVPVPVQIGRDRWRKTTIRIQHLASLTPARRETRVRKYVLADPDHRWQDDYSGLARVGSSLRTWQRRPHNLPVLADPLTQGRAAELDLAELDPEAPLLSAIVISRNDAATIEGVVRTVVEQDCPSPFEVIVAASGADGTAEVVRRRVPRVTVVDVPEPGLPGAARNAGLAVARGEFVSFPGSHVELPQGSLAARLQAHELGYSMVTGSIVNGADTPAGWAGYFLDHSPSLPGRPSGELDEVPAHCSYSREALLEIGGFPEQLRAGEDTVVNRALWARGHRAYRAHDVVLTHRNPCTTRWRLVCHHFARGRALGRLLLAGRDEAAPRRRGLASFLRTYPRWRLERIDSRVEQWGDELRPRYRRVRRLVLLGALAAAAGAFVEMALAGDRDREDLRDHLGVPGAPAARDHH